MTLKDQMKAAAANWRVMTPETRQKGTAAKKKLAEEGGWFGGARYSLAKQQWQLLYELYGPLALDMADDFILWPDERRPERSKYEDWAKEMDEGREIPENVREAFTRRHNAYIRGLGILTYRAMGLTTRKLSKRIDALLEQPEIDAAELASLVKLSGYYDHASKGSSFHYRELQGPRTDKPQQQFNIGGGVRIITGNAPRARLRGAARKLAQGEVIDTTATEV